GGGGSFVFDSSLLAVAGGGGGAGYAGPDGLPGLTTTAGGDGGSNGAPGGTGGTAGLGGGGGQGFESGGGGAGWVSSGADGTGPQNGLGGSSGPSLAGGSGDTTDPGQTPFGGYGGGGGGGFQGGGGGGGYSGGGGGDGTSTAAGGGGGSYLATAFTNTSLLSGVQIGDGEVIISLAENNIDTAQPFYLASQLDSTVAPNFQGGTLRLDTGNPISDNFTLGNFAGNTIDAFGNQTIFTGAFTGAGPLTIEDSVGGGAVILSNSGGNTYLGATTVNSGTLAAGAINAFSPNSAVVLANSATALLDLNGFNNTIDGLSGGGSAGGNVRLDGATLTVNGGGSYGGVIYDGGASGSLVVGNSTLTLTGASTYTGSTTINSGATLALSGSGSIAASSGVVANGTFDISQTTVPVSIASLSGSGAVALGSQFLTLNNASGTFSGVISDGGIGGGVGGGLIIGGGTETLTGANTYTFVTEVVSGATLALGGTGSIANSLAVEVSGTLDISQTTSGASISNLQGYGPGAVYLGSRTLTLTGGFSSFSGVIADGGIGGGTGGSLVLAGGTETLTGVNTYTGSTTINPGATLALSGTGSIAASSGVVANGTFDISQTASGASIGGVSGSGTVFLGGQALTLTGVETFSGVIADGGISGGTGGRLILADGAETLTGVNTYTGSTTINAGATLVLSGSGSIAASSGVTANGRFDIAPTAAGASIANLSGSGFVDVGSQTLTLTSASGIFSGVIADGGIGGGLGGRLTIASGVETLTGINAYRGATTISSGATLALAGSGANATSSGVVANGTFDISQTTSGAYVADLSGSGAVALGGKTLTLTNASGTFSGVIADGGIGAGSGGSLIFAGGTETLTGANTYTGATTINSGATLALGGSGSIAASSVTANGTLDISQTTSGTSVASLSGFGSVALGSQALTLTNTSGTFSGVIADGGIGGGTGGSLTVAGGTQTLSGVNTYTGATTIKSGATLAIAGSGSIATSSGVADNGTLDISQTNSGASIASLSGSGAVVLGGQVLTVASGIGTFSGVISQSGAGGSVGSLILASGTQILTGMNTYTGNTAIAAGATVQVGAGGNSGSIAGNVANDGALVFDRAGAVTYSGVAFGTGTLTQAGPGTTILNSANTFTGVTTVQQGVLEVGDASHASASLAGNVVVGAAGTLRGHGSIAGSVTNTAGGTVAPGGTIGTLTVGSYTQGPTSTLAIEVSPTAASELVATGAVSLGGKLALTFDPGTYAAHVYQIISAASLTGTFSSVTQGGSVPGGGIVYSLSYGPKQADLVVESTGGAQIYGGIGTATLDEARGFASLVEDRSGEAGCADGSADTRTRDCKMGAWAQAIASTDNVGTAASGFGFNNTGAGAMGGLDRRVGDNATVGAAFGFQQNDLRMGGASATASGSSYFGALYAHWIVGPAWIDGQGFYMHSNWAVNRTVAGSGAVTSNPNGGTKGFLVQASLPVGADFRPYARFTYANFDRDGVTETGLTGAGYALPLASSRTALAEAGLQWAHSWAVPGGIELRPALEMGVQNDLADQNRDVSGTLEGIADTGFTVSSVRLPPTAGVADASLKVKVSRRFELTADLRDRFSANQTDASASFGGLFRF
ncbi:MAG TPA: autotransporter-associated beta strand repeat-containing protein, partial [Caulobacteraceae bacterium]|nr:autotransporter-associated beta strand repeat-containing protein [Caulobacteraceae bacterium]